MRLRTMVGALMAALALVGCADTCDDEPGVACTWMGTGQLGLGPDGQHRRETSLYWSFDMEFAPDGTPYVIDWNNHTIRRVLADQTVETVVGDFVGDGPPDMSDLTEPGAPGLEVRLNHPTDLQFDADGDLLIMAWHNHKIRVFDPTDGNVTVMCGRGAGFAGDGAELGAATRLNQPKALVILDDGSMILLDQRNHRIRAVDPEGMVTTIVGTGMPGFAGDGGPALEAQLQFEAGGNPKPSDGIAVAEDGTLYIADGLNHRIRRVQDGIIDTVVGTGEPGYGGDGGPGTDAQIQHPRDLEVGPDGRVYFADTENHRIRAWDPETSVVETVVGTGEAALGEEGVLATEIALNRPFGVAFGPDGALYVADTLNSRYLRIPR